MRFTHYLLVLVLAVPALSAPPILTPQERAWSDKTFVYDNPLPGERPEYREARKLEGYMEFVCLRTLKKVDFSEKGMERFFEIAQNGRLGLPGVPEFTIAINWAKSVVMSDKRASEMQRLERFHTLHLALNEVIRLSQGER